METRESLTSQIADYEAFLREEYQPSTIKGYKKAVQRFVEWVKETQPASETQIEPLMLEYINPNNQVDGRHSITTVRTAIRLFYYFLTDRKLSPCERSSSNESIEREAMDYALYLERVARLSPPTRQSHQNCLRRFLYRLFPSSQFDSSAISVSVLQSFLTTEMTHFKPSSRKAFIGVIRSYCRYLRFKGVEVDKGLLVLPLSAPVWKVASVPKTLTPKGTADCARMRILVAFTTLRMRVLGPLTGQQVQSGNSFLLAKIETKKKSSK
ncbi:MAG: site-specific integrase, partial [Firmicutes bacterium]|nr:site-specific integrase [Dethiobacter sp.]MBS3888750.1 site-specific integrase [Bacillota bacterium]